ncbi:hypothetical protein F5Y09DRAFT_228945 [Xylaria sp. FL1042]|nr:hypothetical protein F5Y09DRAFT_228945 [Xylaria sp. FL1042]
MEEQPRARSILELLTHRNPHVILSPDGGINTHNPLFLWPRKVKKWEEFCFENLEKIYEGQLMSAARSPRFSLPCYPFVLNKDCRIEDEPMTTSLISKWNDTIVSAALDAVKDELNPSIWVQKASKPDQSALAPKIEAKGTKKTAKISLRPDSGAYSIHEQDQETKEERFPKDYKYAGCWNSLKIRNGEHVDTDTGEWRPGFVRRNDNMPIRQAYTYSVLFQCRYGCILTTAEAFIFRIRPLDQSPEAKGRSDKKATPQEAVKESGLMEYASIPWRHGTDENNDKYNKLTVNLALWVLHVLAGNNHKILQNYPELRTEKLSPPVCRPEKTQQKSHPKRPRESEGSHSPKSSSGKRQKVHVSHDRIYLSFADDLPFKVEPNVEGSTTERDSSDDDDDDDDDGGGGGDDEDVEKEVELQQPRERLRPRKTGPGKYKC